jgi:uroporphyrinogen decarboxylase
VVANPIEGAADIGRLDGDAGAAMAPTCEAIRRLRAELGDGAAVIGFAGAPWTLLAYASEQRLSRDLEVLSRMTYREPELVLDLLERMAEITAETLAVQIEAGADVVQIFDTWAGQLSVPRFERFAGRALRRVLELLPDERPPVIVFARGAAHLTDALAELGCDVVSLDWRVDLGEAAARIGGVVSLQGNLEPSALAGDPDEIAAATAELIAAGRKARGHVVNLGHGVLPSIPVEGVEAFVRAAQRGYA